MKIKEGKYIDPRASMDGEEIKSRRGSEILSLSKWFPAVDGVALLKVSYDVRRTLGVLVKGEGILKHTPWYKSEHNATGAGS